jgi:hypothetical protein
VPPRRNQSRCTMIERWGQAVLKVRQIANRYESGCSIPNRNCFVVLAGAVQTSREAGKSSRWPFLRNRAGRSYVARKSRAKP